MYCSNFAVVSDLTYLVFGDKHVLYYLCCFCPDSSFSLSHFLGEPSSIYDKFDTDWAPNQNLGYDFRGVSASIQE